MSETSHLPVKTVQEAAAYIRDMATELAAMARAAQCGTLNSVLEMAEMEAGRVVEAPKKRSSRAPSRRKQRARANS